MDLFVVPTIGFKLLYAFVIVRLNRRDLVWITTTTPELEFSVHTDFGSFSLFAGNWPHGILGVLQHYLPCVDGSGWRNDVYKRLRCVRTGGRRVFRYILLVLKVVLLCCSATRHWAAG